MRVGHNPYLSIKLGLNACTAVHVTRNWFAVSGQSVSLVQESPAALTCSTGPVFEVPQPPTQNEGRKLNHMEVAAEKRRAADPVGEAKRQRELQEQRNEKKRKCVNPLPVRQS